MTRRALTVDAQARTAAQRLPPLLIAAERLAAHLQFGEHGRRKTGPGEQFWEYRTAQSGDALSAIDWRRSARSDEVFVRQQEWQAGQTAAIFCDRSASMAYSGSRDRPVKIFVAQVLCLALAVALDRGGEGSLLLGETLPPGRGHLHLSRAARLLEQPVEQAHGVLPAIDSKLGAVILASDFLGPEDEILPPLRAAVAKVPAGVIFQVLDPVEEAFPFAGRTVFRPMQGEEEFESLRAEALREPYRERLAARTESLRGIAASAGWGFRRVFTDESLAPVLVWAHRWLSGTMSRR